MLEIGGNAVDAAVATSLALSVVRPDSCGIGGGGFMLIHLEDHPSLGPGDGPRDIALNYRETCPAGIGPDSYEQADDPLASRVGGMAVGVPGTVAGLLHALEIYGTLDRATVLSPAIELAEGGWAIDRHHAETARSVWESFEKNPAGADRFSFVAGTLTRSGTIRIGDRLRNPAQARTLRRIAADGRSGFYEGPVAAAIVQAVQHDGGVLTLDDLRAYRVSETDPIRVKLGDVFDGPHGSRSMLVMPPPSSGGVAIAQMFGLLERIAVRGGFDMPATGYPDADSARLLIESMKHAFADRSRHLADPAFVALPIDAMLDPANLDRTADRIASGEPIAHHRYGVFDPGEAATIPADDGTSHISVVDSRGNAVSCTETINLAFGSLLAPDGLGFCLNNEMDDFTTVRGKANAFGLAQSDDNLPQPGKRPLSSMSPTIVLDGKGDVLAVAGASGGPRIINATAQSLLRVLVAGATAEQAVHAPRLHHQWTPDAVYFESKIDQQQPAEITRMKRALRTDLEVMGYDLRDRLDIGSCQLIRRVDRNGSFRGAYESASDPRKRNPR